MHEIHQWTYIRRAARDYDCDRCFAERIVPGELYERRVMAVGSRMYVLRVHLHCPIDDPEYLREMARIPEEEFFDECESDPADLPIAA